MTVSREVRAAIGDVVVETTWIEYLVARLAEMGRRVGCEDNEDGEEYIRSLLRPSVPRISSKPRGVRRGSLIAQRRRLKPKSG
jgi:hypothetical protein